MLIYKWATVEGEDKAALLYHNPGPSWTTGPESVFKSWRKPLSFFMRSLNKLVQNRAKISHGSDFGLFSSPCIPGNVFLCHTTAKNIQIQQTSTHAASSAMSACQRGSMYGMRWTDGGCRDGERMAAMQR